MARKTSCAIFWCPGGREFYKNSRLIWYYTPCLWRKNMKHITKIMVGCDCSKYSEETLAYAAGLASKLQASLIIINVINKKEIDTILKVAEGQFDRTIEKYVEKSVDDYVRRVKAERGQQLEKLIEDVGCAHLPIRKIFKIGTPFQELIQAMEEEKAELMVIGSKGHGDISGVLFGSQAEKMFRRCPVPLLSVR
jgi:nucleotide-binding universal stress UspA family protein